MAYKNASNYDGSELRERLSEIRDTVAYERERRLMREATKSVASFRSGQDQFRKTNGDNGKGKRW